MRITETERPQVLAALQARFAELDKPDIATADLVKMENLADAIDTLRAATGPVDIDASGITVDVPAPAVMSTDRRRATLGDAQRLVNGSRHQAKPRKTDRVGVQLLSQYRQPIQSADELHREFADTLNRVRSGPSRGRTEVIVASADYAREFPADRRLTSDAIDSTAKIEALVGRDSLTATGGICGPVNVTYDVPTFGVADRPLKAGLPGFGADRGGVTFQLPPTLAATAAGVGIWTAATDANPQGATKPRVALQCGNTNTVLVDAITERALVGNMLTKFAPEMMEALLQTLSVNAARTAEIYLLGKIAANSTPVSAAQLLGATRDLLATLDLSAAAYRWRQRIPRSSPLTIVLPDWVRDMMRADLVREQANSDPLAVTDAEVQAWFSTRSLAPIWLLDGLAANVTGIPFAAQGFGSQPTGGLLDWPRTVVFWLFSPGTFVHLDGGSLNVGVVRDATLNSTNDCEIFNETFEGIAFRGLTSLQVVANVRPNGASAAPVSTSAY